jgi:gluconate 2-dehydrogenase gamma chain
LDPSTQDTILGRLEAGQVLTAWPADPTHFFQMVIEHVMEGYYSDPGNGGNRDAIAWRMIGFTGRE